MIKAPPKPKSGLTLVDQAENWVPADDNGKAMMLKSSFFLLTRAEELSPRTRTIAADLLQWEKVNQHRG
jgi:hypothetical protein